MGVWWVVLWGRLGRGVWSRGGGGVVGGGGISGGGWVSGGGGWSGGEGFVEWVGGR